MNNISSRAPFIHYRASDEVRTFDGSTIWLTLCGKWETPRYFITDAPMGGILCNECARQNLKKKGG